MEKCFKLATDDRISTLPSNIIELILMCLPIAEAVRTSILSTRWRYQWCTIPHLTFGGQTFSSTSKYKLESIVDHVLLLHIGPIHRFVFDGRNGIEDIAFVDRWLTFLSRNYLKELSLKFWSDDRYKLPLALYFCHAIVSLDLCGCKFKIPRSFNGFNCLTTLLLEHISISAVDFASLVSKCPLLRKLVFIGFYRHFHLKVNAPMLQELVVEGIFSDIHLEHTPDLVSLSLSLMNSLMNEDGGFDSEDEDMCYFTSCLSNIPKIERLELRQNSLNLVTKRDSFVQFPTFSCLKEVLLRHFDFEDPKHVMALDSLLQNTPVLNKLELEATSDECNATAPISSFLDRKENPNFNCDGLRIVKLNWLSGNLDEMEFIEFILFSASRLESLIIELDLEALEKVELLKKIMQFRRSSSRAEIIIFD